ncbi:unnamed protein product [Diamesa tonsa]
MFVVTCIVTIVAVLSDDGGHNYNKGSNSYHVHNINKHHYEKTPVYHIIKVFNNNNNNNKEEHIHSSPGRAHFQKSYNPTPKASAPALNIQNQHVPSSPSIQLKGADVSIGNQFNQATDLDSSYKGYDLENQEQDLAGLEYAEFEPTSYSDHESLEFERNNKKQSMDNLFNEVPDVQLKDTEKISELDTTKVLSSYLTSQQSAPKSNVRLENANKALGVQASNYYPKSQVPAKITSYQGSSKGHRQFESYGMTPPSINTVIREPKAYSYHGQKSSGFSSFRPSQSEGLKSYSSSYQYPIPSNQLSQKPQTLYAGISDQSSALLASYKKPHGTTQLSHAIQVSQVSPQTYSTYQSSPVKSTAEAVTDNDFYSSYKPNYEMASPSDSGAESYSSSLGSYNPRPYYSYTQAPSSLSSSYIPQASGQSSSFVSSPSTSFNYGNSQYYTPSSKTHQSPKLLSNTRDEVLPLSSSSSAAVASNGQKQLSYGFLPSYNSYGGTSKYY